MIFSILGIFFFVDDTTFIVVIQHGINTQLTITAKVCSLCEITVPAILGIFTSVDSHFYYFKGQLM